MAPSNEIILRPAVIYTFLKVIPIMLLSIAFLLFTWTASSWFLLLSILLSAWACYRFIYIRKLSYIITPEYLKFSRGVFFKRIDEVEISRMKDYVIIQSAMASLFRFMHLILKSSDTENPVIHLRAIPESDIVEVIRGYILAGQPPPEVAEIK